MIRKINLSGVWSLQLDKEKNNPKPPYSDTIYLPGTTSSSRKGEKNNKIELGCLTDEYRFEGYAWFSRTVLFPDDIHLKKCYLFLERTRKTRLWIDGILVGGQNSLCTPHVYDISDYVSPGEHIITICVDNTDYPISGGHMTASDTQTNWNGITGKIEVQVFNKIHFEDIQIYPNVAEESIMIKAKVTGTQKGIVSVYVKSVSSIGPFHQSKRDFSFDSSDIEINYKIGPGALLWSEFEPNLYNICIRLIVDGIETDHDEIMIGLREFKTNENKFKINGVNTFLRGKHEALNYPLTGYTPTTVDEWLRILKISKNYGINHFRFHTCCPPEAAFIAADMLGVYMEPELPFWGTITDENYDKHNQEGQDYLISEGLEILRRFGNHPSFVMMSLGNELWGSQKRLNKILEIFKKYDNRHLYIQGSNNFQFSPCILKNDDFFCGVRFSKNRLLRGSYASCDAPLGHVQSDKPNTLQDYDESICPKRIDNEDKKTEGETIKIQIGTGVKEVKASKNKTTLLPKIPIVSHEIGQYAMYPNFHEIKKYKGSLKARNFEVFQKRLEQKGLGDLAEKYFYCSGKLAVACYKEELEAAFRSKKLAGFQLLDLQDYSGQGTALVGVLDAFLDSKGLVSPEEWCSFCSDAVLLARFGRYNYVEKEMFNAHIELSYYRQEPLRDFTLLWELKDHERIYCNGRVPISANGYENHIDIYDIETPLPNTETVKKLQLNLEIDQQDIKKAYHIWVYPDNTGVSLQRDYIFSHMSEKAISYLRSGKNVVLFPNPEYLRNAVNGFYCTDFWSYPMFRNISESMGKPIPVGTMGLMIDHNHPALKDFACEEYSTCQWWEIVTHSVSIILDDTPGTFRPIVQTIDNFERNHKLSLLFECKVLNGVLIVCSVDYNKIQKTPEGRQFLISILNYASSANPNLCTQIDRGSLEKILV